MEDKNDRNSKIELHCEEVQELMGRIPSWILRWGITIIAVILLGFLVGTYFFEYPDTLTAPIIITSSTPPVELNAHATGKLDTLFVQDKQEVKQGDYLGIIENSANIEDIQELYLIFQDWKSKKISMNHFYGLLKQGSFKLGEIQTSYSVFFDALHNYVSYHETDYYPKKISLKRRQEAKKLELDSNRKNEYVLHQKQSEIAKSIYLRDSTLFARKIKTGAEFDNALYSYLQTHQVQLNDISAQKEEQIKKLQESEILLDLEQQYRETYDKSILDLNKAATQFEDAIKLWQKTYVVISPISGYVNMMGIWNKNQNVTTGELVMIVMPKTPTESIGKAKFPAIGAGKIQIGQRVITRLNNYPDEEFGFIEGIVSNISDIPDKDGNYIVEIKFPDNLRTNYGKNLPQTKQILGNAQIIIKDKRLIDVFFQPFEKIFKNKI
jgi:hypothetical protein